MASETRSASFLCDAQEAKIYAVIARPINMLIQRQNLIKQMYSLMDSNPILNFLHERTHGSSWIVFIHSFIQHQQQQNERRNLVYI